MADELRKEHGRMREQTRALAAAISAAYGLDKKPAATIEPIEIAEPCFDAEVTMHEIEQWVARKHGVPVAAIRGPSRCTIDVRARQEFMARAYACHKWSFPQIGRHINRDHTTVLHGVRQWHARLIEADRRAS